MELCQGLPVIDDPPRYVRRTTRDATTGFADRLLFLSNRGGGPAVLRTSRLSWRSYPFRGIGLSDSSGPVCVWKL
jgi:hypothetical protein